MVVCGAAGQFGGLFDLGSVRAFFSLCEVGGALAEPEPEPTDWYALCVYPATLLASHYCDSSVESEITPVV